MHTDHIDTLKEQLNSGVPAATLLKKLQPIDEYAPKPNTGIEFSECVIRRIKYSQFKTELACQYYQKLAASITPYTDLKDLVENMIELDDLTKDIITSWGQDNLIFKINHERTQAVAAIARARTQALEGNRNALHRKLEAKNLEKIDASQRGLVSLYALMNYDFQPEAFIEPKKYRHFTLLITGFLNANTFTDDQKRIVSALEKQFKKTYQDTDSAKLDLIRFMMPWVAKDNELAQLLVLKETLFQSAVVLKTSAQKSSVPPSSLIKEDFNKLLARVNESKQAPIRGKLSAKLEEQILEAAKNRQLPKNIAYQIGAFAKSPKDGVIIIDYLNGLFLNKSQDLSKALATLREELSQEKRQAVLTDEAKAHGFAGVLAHEKAWAGDVELDLKQSDDFSREAQEYLSKQHEKPEDFSKWFESVIKDPNKVAFLEANPAIKSELMLKAKEMAEKQQEQLESPPARTRFTPHTPPSGGGMFSLAAAVADRARTRQNSTDTQQNSVNGTVPSRK